MVKTHMTLTAPQNTNHTRRAGICTTLVINKNPDPIVLWILRVLSSIYSRHGLLCGNDGVSWVFFRQDIPSKRPWVLGIKAYVLAEFETGYRMTITFILEKREEQQHGILVTENIMFSFMRSILHMGYKL